jgi:hypothetical protein
VLKEKKTLRRVSRPFDIGAFDPRYWVTTEDHCWDMAGEIDAAPHFSLIMAAQARRLKPRDSFELHADTIKEFGPNGRHCIKLR